MSLAELLLLLVIAGLAGSIGQALAGYSRGGCLLSIVLGFVGAVIGVWLARNLGLPVLLDVSVGGTNFPVIWSIIGSAIFVAVLGLITRGR